MLNFSKEKIAYSEVYAFINALGDEYKNKIPEKIYRNIENNRELSYKPVYSRDKALQKGEITREALALIAALNLQYWCKDENTRNELKRKYIENGKLEDEKYNNIFKKEEQNINEFKEIQKQAEFSQVNLVEYKEKWYNKLFNFIKRLLRR